MIRTHIWKYFFYTFLLLFVFVIAYAKEKDIVWVELMKIEKIENVDLIIENCLKLKKQQENSKKTQDSVYAKILHIIGRSFWLKGNPEMALNFLNKSVFVNSFSSVSTNRKHLAISLYNLGSYHYELDNFTNSLINFNKCIEILDELNIRGDLRAKAFRIRASIFFIMGDYQKCIENADKSILLSKDNIELNVDAHLEKIQALIELNYLERSNVLLNSIIILSEKKLPNSLTLANLYTLCGKLNVKMNLNLMAQNYFLKSFKIHKKNENYVGTSLQMLSIAECKLMGGKFNEALNLFDISIVFAKDYKINKYRALQKKALTYFRIGEFTFSINTLQSIFSDYYKQDFSLNTTKLPLIQSFKLMNDKEVFFDALALKAETWLAYYHHTHKKEYLQNALETFAVADKMVDYMRREHVGYQSKLFWRDKTHSLYENAIEVCYLLKNYEKGFYFFEKSRAVLLNDKINNLSANQLLSEADQLKERSFQQEISELNSKIESETVEAKKSQWNVKMLDIQESQQKFIGGLAVKYPSYFAFKYDTSMYNLGQLRQYLKKSNTSFIEYFKGDSANYQLVIKPTGVNIIKQKPSENSYEYLINAIDLGKRVIVSQDGEFVPLDTLKNTKGEILLKKYAFSNTYSAQYLLRNAEIKVTNSWLNSFIGFAPVNYSKAMALPSLLGADVALGNVSSNYFWPKNYEKEKATKSNFAKNASDYKIIQLFTHADADNASKEPTIFFADSAMKVSELESFSKFNTELLVLSACKTNVGKVAKGEGTLSMAREFAGLGIPASVTTLWSVENAATYQITELFYKYLKSGEPKDIALQKAKLEYLEVNSREKQDPKYWGAFVLMGETAPIAGFDGKIIYFGAVISLLILGISVYFINRKKTNVGQIPNFTN